MKQLSCLPILFVVLSFQAIGQQTVHKKLNQLMLEESFSELNNLWPVLTNDDNFFVFDEGEYFMNRTKAESPYAVMSAWENDLTSFSVRTSLMLGPVENTNQSLGLIIRASNSGQSAIICEINKFHRFRIRQLIEGNYVTLTSEGKDGWVKNSVVKGVNEYNDLNIKTNGTDHDLYINGILVHSFRIEGLEAGSFGLFIGPETKGRVDFLTIHADELYRDKTKIYLSDQEIRDLITKNEKLKQELYQLTKVERPAISQQIADARDKGDLSENAEYDAAKEAQGMLEMHISKLEATLSTARIIDESQLDTSKALIHSTVKIKNTTNYF